MKQFYTIIFILLVACCTCFARYLEEIVLNLEPRDTKKQIDTPLNRQKRQFNFGSFPQFGAQNSFPNQNYGGFGGLDSSLSDAGANSNSNNGLGSFSSAANAFAHGNYFGLNGFGSSSSNAQAQAFGANAPFGDMGASASNANTQSFDIGPNGINANSAFSGAQSYKLFNGKTLNIVYASGFNLGSDGKPEVANSNSFNFSK